MSKQIEKNQKALLTIRRKLLKLKQSPIYKEIKQQERLDSKQAKIVKETMIVNKVFSKDYSNRIRFIVKEYSGYTVSDGHKLLIEGLKKWVK